MEKLCLDIQSIYSNETREVVESCVALIQAVGAAVTITQSNEESTIELI